MSTAQAVPPEHQIRDAVVVPVFFEKLASYGVRPANETEAQAMLEMGEALLVAHQEEQVKEASSKSNVILAAHAHLAQTLGQKAAAVQDGCSDHEAGLVVDELLKHHPDLQKAASAVQQAALSRLQPAA